MRTLFSIVIAASILVAACSRAGEPPAESGNRETDERAPLASATAEQPVKAGPSLPDDLRTRVVADAAQRAGVPESGVTVRSAESVEWPDGSLGCPQPGVMYTQAIVSGYRVLVEVGEQTLDYRVPLQGGLQICAVFGGLIDPPQPKEPERQ